MGTLVDALIQAIAAQVVTAAAKEVQFVLEYRDQFVEMKKGLESMKALLGDTEHVKSSYARIEVTLDELREVIYEADNALTDCLLRDDEIEKYNKPNPCSCCYRFFYLQLLGDPSFSHRMGKKLTAINLKMKRIEGTLDGYLSKSPSQHPNDDQEVEFRSQDSEPGVTYGLKEDTEMLKGWILGSREGKEVERIGIVGMGGLGKTTIARKLFNDPKLISDFDKIMWVCASRNFSANRIVKRLLGRAGKPVSESHVNCMLSTLNGVLKDKSYLIVIDDVWPSNGNSWWSELYSNLPKTDGKPSCVIITTRNEDVARRMVANTGRIHKPKHLSDADSLSLFKESVSFQRYEGSSQQQQEQLVAVGKQILEKCGGLPLAIKAVGSLLASKQNNDSLAVWEDTKNRFHKIMTTEQETETDQVMISLQLSYDELPTRLKHCLLCLSIYPEDFEIQAQQLIHWWIAEGLVQAEDSKTAIDLGYEYLQKLVNRCLVEVVDQRGYDGRIYKCKIHDMVRELITKIADKEAFCSFNEQGLQRQRDGYRWLCFTDDMAPADNKDDHEMQRSVMIKPNQNLRALFLMSSPQNGFGSNFECMQSIRLLDLSYSKLDDQSIGIAVANAKESDRTSSTAIQPVISVEELFRCIAFLKRLACLNLSGVQKLQQVPSTIRKLLNLRILVLNGCSNLTQIHQSITDLKRLIVLDLGACPYLQDLPQGLGRLSSLQELYGFRVARRNAGLVELQNLSQLRVLQIVISAKASQDEMKDLSSLTNLQVLDIDAEEGTQTCEVLGGLKLPPNLQELYLRNYHSEQMPMWFHPTQLGRLRYLCIENCDIVNLPVRFNWKIEGLCMKLLSMLVVDWEKLKVSMPILRYMEISSCPNLKNFPVDKLGVWRKKQGN